MFTSQQLSNPAIIYVTWDLLTSIKKLSKESCGIFIFLTRVMPKYLLKGVLFIFIMRQSEPGIPLQYFLVVFIIFQFVNNCPAVFSATKMTTSVNNNSRQGGLKNISVSTLKPCKPLHTSYFIEYENIKVDQLIWILFLVQCSSNYYQVKTLTSI